MHKILKWLVTGLEKLKQYQGPGGDEAVEWKPVLLNALVVVAGAVILCSAAFYNGYPIIYPDTGAYIAQAHDWAGDRFGYGMFLRFAGLDYSLWGAIFFQGLFLAISIFVLLKRLLKKRGVHYCFLAILVLLCTYTGISFWTCYLTPDIFAPIAYLCMALVLLNAHFDLWSNLFFALLFLLAAVTHGAHYPASAMLAFTVIAIHLVQKLILKRRIIPLTVIPANAIFVGAMLLTSFLFNCTVNCIAKQGFALSSNSQAFLVARMSTNGMLKEFLEKYGKSGHYRLYNYRNALPKTEAEYMFGYKSPLYLERNKNVKLEYKRLVRETIIRPDFFVRHVFKALTSAAQQFFSFDTFLYQVFSESDTVVIGRIRQYFPSDYNMYLLSRQQRNIFENRFLNNRQQVFIFLSILLLIVMLFKEKPEGPEEEAVRTYTLFLIFATVVNAMLYGSVSAVDPRYQGKAVWILPLVVSINLICLYRKYLKPRVAQLLGRNTEI